MYVSGPLRQEGTITDRPRITRRALECGYLQCDRETIPALLVAIGAPKPRSLGIEVPESLPSNPEHRLYDLLSVSEPDAAHSRYNALIRKLVSFERALALQTSVTKNFER